MFKGGVVFASGREMSILSTIFRDFGKNMVGNGTFSAGNYWKK